MGGVSPTPKGPPLAGHVPTQGNPQVGMALPHCGECLQKLEVGQVFKNPLTREVFQRAEADRLAIWWGGTLWVEKLSAQNSAAEPQYPPRYGPRKFLTILHEWLLGAAVA